MAKNSAIEIYIPHSSDKTKFEVEKVFHNSGIYIPHSSDKTCWNRLFKALIYTQIYIPHSSDKTILTCLLKFLFWFYIYIPHSSDKTISTRYKYIVELDLFISHIVQIKPFGAVITSAFSSIFISHIVQIKLIKIIKWYTYLVFFIYIPHSSDKTVLEIVSCLTDGEFISHIVQIKL